MKDKNLFVSTLIFFVLFIVFIVGIFSSLNIVFSPFITTLVLVYWLNPIVSYLKKKGISGKYATFIVIISIILCAVFIIIFAYPKFSEALKNINSVLTEFSKKYNLSFENFSSGIGVAYTTAVNVVKWITVLAVGAVSAFYILNDCENIKTSLLEFIPQNLKPSFKVLADDIKMILDSFFKGQLLIAGILCILDGIFLYALRVPYAVGLGAIAGILDIIPYAGAFIGIGIILIVTFLSVPDKIIWVLIGLLIIQQIENNLITPKISANTLNLHPAAVVLVLYVGAFGGFWGILLSVPVACIMKKFFQRFLQSIV